MRSASLDLDPQITITPQITSVSSHPLATWGTLGTGRAAPPAARGEANVAGTPAALAPAVLTAQAGPSLFWAPSPRSIGRKPQHAYRERATGFFSEGSYPAQLAYTTRLKPPILVVCLCCERNGQRPLPACHVFRVLPPCLLCASVYVSNVHVPFSVGGLPCCRILPSA